MRGSASNQVTQNQLNAARRSAGANRVQPGRRFISPANAGAQMTPDAMRRAQASATASISQMNNNPNLIRGTAPRSIAPRSGNMGQYNKVSRSARRDRAVAQAAKDAAPNPIKEMVKPKPIKKSFMSGKGLAIGAGAAVIAGLAMNRRGDGTSSGRAGMTRY
jgi:hypothetical protein